MSASDLSALVKAIEALVAEQSTLNKKMDALLKRPAAASAAAAAVLKTVKAGGKRGAKPKAEKAPKAEAPPAADGTIRFGLASAGDYKEFSNFFKSEFNLGGKTYASVANYFHSAKFLGTDDDYAERIRTQKNPAITRALASSVKEHAPRADWDGVKSDILRSALVAKFSSNAALLRKLLDTGAAPLESSIEEEMRVEGFWSVGKDGAGANRMGVLLAGVRDELRAGGVVAPEVAAPAPVAKPKKATAAAPAPAPVAKKVVPPPADSDSDSDSDSDEEDEEEEAPKVVAKPAPAAAKPTVKAPADSDSDSEEEEEEESDEE